MTIKTPADKLITANAKGGTVKGILHWNTNFGARKTASYQRAQKFLDSEVLRRCDPLTPYRNNKLIQSGVLATRIGEGLVQYSSPYARYQYYGKVMIGRAPKTVTNTNLKHVGAPTRGAKWFERMKVKDKNDILKGAGKIVGE